MGGLLSQPITNKESLEGEGLGLRYGLSSMQGWRPEMEDAHGVKIGLDYGLNDWSYFAVFDGHAGRCAAVYAAYHLLDHILRDSEFELGADPIEIKREEVLEVLKKASKESPGDEKSSDPYIIDVNSENFSGYTQQLSNEPNGQAEQESQARNTDGVSESEKKNVDQQNPSDVNRQNQNDIPKPKFTSSPVAEQLKMVKNAIRSGFLKIDQNFREITPDTSGCTAVCTLISPTHLFVANCGDSRAVLWSKYNTTQQVLRFATEDHKPFHPVERKRIIEAGGTATVRINGTLAVSRALGDFDFKKDGHRGPCEQLVSPEPEITVIERHNSRDEFLILACDGIWDVMNNVDLCEYVQYQLKIEPSLEKVCASVLDLCLRKNSRDNMSIIIVVFPNGPSYDEKEAQKAKENDLILLKKIEEISKLHPDQRFHSFLEFLGHIEFYLKSHSINDYLPPGAGIEAKHDLIEAFYDKNIRSLEGEE